MIGAQETNFLLNYDPVVPKFHLSELETFQMTEKKKAFEVIN